MAYNHYPPNVMAQQGFQLQESDIELVHHIHQLRAATLRDHLAPLTGRSEKALRARLLKLASRRYIKSVARSFQKHVFVLGPEAIPVLLEAGFASSAIAGHRIRDGELKPMTFQHLLFVSDILTKLFIAQRGCRIKIVDCQHDGPALWDSAMGLDGNGTEARFPVRPDLKITLQDTTRPDGRNLADFFLEADRGTMSGDRMEEKIRGYLAYHREQRYAKKYPGMKTFQVLTVTETRSRARYLETHLSPLLPTGPARRAYGFVAFEDLRLDDLFSAPALKN